MTKNKKILAIQVLYIIGMLVALFLTYEHFAPQASKFCTFGDSFDCGIVNKSPYANLDGISYLLTIDFKLPIPLIDITGLGLFFDLLTSNAFLGFLMFVFLFLLLHFKARNRKFLWIERHSSLSWLRGLTIFSIAYGFYLFLIQHFVLKTYCLFCIAMDLLIIASLILLYKIKDGK